MPNPEHLAKLKESVGAWNAWREENPDVIPNLTGADLRTDGLDSDQLCRANSFVNAKLDEALANQAMNQCPEKFEEP